MMYTADVKHDRGIKAYERIACAFRISETDGGYCVMAADFGCSRIYRDVSPEDALVMFLREHACTPYNTQVA